MWYDEAVVKKLAALVAVHIKAELQSTNGGSGKLPPRLLTVKECARWFNLSEQAIQHKLHRDPEFRACTVSGFGRRRLFDVRKLEAFLLRNGV